MSELTNQEKIKFARTIVLKTSEPARKFLRDGNYTKQEKDDIINFVIRLCSENEDKLSKLVFSKLSKNDREIIKDFEKKKREKRRKKEEQKTNDVSLARLLAHVNIPVFGDVPNKVRVRQVDRLLNNIEDVEKKHNIVKSRKSDITINNDGTIALSRNARRKFPQFIKGTSSQQFGSGRSIVRVLPGVTTHNGLTDFEKISLAINGIIGTGISFDVLSRHIPENLRGGFSRFVAFVTRRNLPLDGGAAEQIINELRHIENIPQELKNNIVNDEFVTDEVKGVVGPINDIVKKGSKKLTKVAKNFINNIIDEKSNVDGLEGKVFEALKSVNAGEAIEAKTLAFLEKNNVSETTINDLAETARTFTQRVTAFTRKTIKFIRNKIRNKNISNDLKDPLLKNNTSSEIELQKFDEFIKNNAPELKNSGPPKSSLDGPPGSENIKLDNEDLKELNKTNLNLEERLKKLNSEGEDIINETKKIINKPILKVNSELFNGPKPSSFLPEVNFNNLPKNLENKIQKFFKEMNDITNRSIISAKDLPIESGKLVNKFITTAIKAQNEIQKISNIFNDEFFEIPDSLANLIKSRISALDDRLLNARGIIKINAESELKSLKLALEKFSGTFELLTPEERILAKKIDRFKLTKKSNFTKELSNEEKSNFNNAASGKNLSNIELTEEQKQQLNEEKQNEELLQQQEEQLNEANAEMDSALNNGAEDIPDVVEGSEIVQDVPEIADEIILGLEETLI